jgi:hypothetical protein
MAAASTSARAPLAAALAVVACLSGTLSGCSGRRTQYLGDEAAAPAQLAATSSPSATPTATVVRRWWSGASSERAANGSYGRWRKAPLQIGGTWDNGNAEQVAMRSVCPGGTWARWNAPLDLAIGAIDRSTGETWAAAAAGRYDARWTTSLLRLKSCWGSRNSAYLYIRFAHELNLSSMKWYVQGGEEAAFAKAATRFSDLRYRILPKAKIVLCPSDETDGRLKVSLAKLWPGKDRRGRQVINVYAVDTYNGYHVVRTAEEFAFKLDDSENGNPFGLETHRQFAETHGVPFAISEWSNNGNPRDAGKGGEAPEYVRQMNAWFRDHAGDPRHPAAGTLLYEIQFNLMDQFQFLPTRHQPKTAATYRTLIWGR